MSNGSTCNFVNLFAGWQRVHAFDSCQNTANFTKTPHPNLSMELVNTYNHVCLCKQTPSIIIPHQPAVNSSDTPFLNPLKRIWQLQDQPACCQNIGHPTLTFQDAQPENPVQIDDLVIVSVITNHTLQCNQHIIQCRLIKSAQIRRNNQPSVADNQNIGGRHVDCEVSPLISAFRANLNPGWTRRSGRWR